MKPKIEKPKVFISYAWGAPDYQKKVIEFAHSLLNCGIDVELDKWSLKEGNDTYAFMEQTVQNPEITNVLILLDKNYTEKANNRSGGVGTETQIISPEIYNKTKQEKFIPIVFERGMDDEVYKPTYLKGLLHFDLSKDENYEFEFKRLIRRLFGVEILKKPELGTMPNWLDEDTKKPVAKIDIANIRKVRSNDEKKILISAELKKINKKLIDFSLPNEGINNAEIINVYSQLQNEIRNSYLQIIKSFIFDTDINKSITECFEDVIQGLNRNDFLDKLKLSIIHETFIYYIALLFKNEKYSEIGYVLSKTYFYKNYDNNPVDNYNVFYFHNDMFDKIINRRDNKTYFCGTAQFWVENIAMDFCSINELVMADIILFNYSVYSPKYMHNWYWFPVLYVYFDRFSNPFRDYSIKLVSKERAENMLKMMSFSDINEAKKIFKDVENQYDGSKILRYRYKSSFDDAPMFMDYVKSEDLAKYE